MVNVIIIDSDEEEREKINRAIVSYPNFEIIGLGRDCYDAVKLAEKKKPDILVMEQELMDGESASLIPLIKSKSPETSVILLTSFADEKHIRIALAHAPEGYIAKWRAPQCICRALDEIMQGGCFIGPDVVSKVSAIFSQMALNETVQRPCKPSAILTVLTGIEFRLIVMISEGLTTREISRKLSITEGTTRNYISAVLRKTGTSNRNQLTLFALRHGIIDLEFL